MTDKKNEPKQGGLRLFPRFWRFLFSSICFIFLFFFLVAFGLFGDLPNIAELENPKNSLSSEVYSEDGVLMGKYFLENRTKINHDAIAPCVFDALIATEDIRFAGHSGIDPKGTARAVLNMGRDGGASTITQQLAKNMFSLKEKPKFKLMRIMQKFKEWIISVRLERRYTKEEIITMYLNTVPFSGVSFGIDAASKEFFNKPPSKLKPEEAAVLIGMLKANSAYNPRMNPERSMQRRNIVMSQMVKYNMLDEASFLKIKDKPIKLDYHNTEFEGQAIYFRDYMAKYLKEWCKQNGLDLYRSGLKIYTTINSKAQKMAEEAVAKHMAKLQYQFEKSWGKEVPWRKLEKNEIIPDFIEKALKRTERYQMLQEKYPDDEKAIIAELKKPVKMTIFTWRGDVDTVMSPYDSMRMVKKVLHAGFIGVEPETGHVKAWVGGINHKYFKFDHVNIDSRRQVGSTFKPIVYATAMDINKTSPCTVFPRVPTVFNANGKPWSPRNADGSAGGSMTMAQGLAMSDNLITAQIMKSLGSESPQMVIKFAERVGIVKNRIPPVYSICLGTMELSPYEMASAFSAFVNKGLWVEPTFITRIEDNKGNILKEFNTPRHDQVLSEEKAYLMFKLLKGGVEFGTGSSLKPTFKLEGEFGGKTGTTQGGADGWYMGVNKNLVCATWVGADDPVVRFRNAFYGQGALMALPIYGYFMQNALKSKDFDVDVEMIEKPKTPGSIMTECGEDVDEGAPPPGMEGDLEVDGLGG